jgi:hypothetical protein
MMDGIEQKAKEHVAKRGFPGHVSVHEEALGILRRSSRQAIGFGLISAVESQTGQLPRRARDLWTQLRRAP